MTVTLVGVPATEEEEEEEEKEKEEEEEYLIGKYYTYKISQEIQRIYNQILPNVHVIIQTTTFLVLCFGTHVCGDNRSL